MAKKFHSHLIPNMSVLRTSDPGRITLIVRRGIDLSRQLLDYSTVTS